MRLNGPQTELSRTSPDHLTPRAECFYTTAVATKSHQHWLPTDVLADFDIRSFWPTISASSILIIFLAITLNAVTVKAAFVAPAAAVGFATAADATEAALIGSCARAQHSGCADASCTELHAQSCQPGRVWKGQLEGSAMWALDSLTMGEDQPEACC